MLFAAIVVPVTCIVRLQLRAGCAVQPNSGRHTNPKTSDYGALFTAKLIVTSYEFLSDRLTLTKLIIALGS